MPIVKNLKEARRLPVRVEEQQAQQLAMNPPRSAGDDDDVYERRWVLMFMAMAGKNQKEIKLREKVGDGDVPIFCCYKLITVTSSEVRVRM